MVTKNLENIGEISEEILREISPKSISFPEYPVILFEVEKPPSETQLSTLEKKLMSYGLTLKTENKIYCNYIGKYHEKYYIVLTNKNGPGRENIIKLKQFLESKIKKKK